MSRFLRDWLSYSALIVLFVVGIAFLSAPPFLAKWTDTGWPLLLYVPMIGFFAALEGRRWREPDD